MISTSLQYARRLVAACSAAGVLLLIGFAFADARAQPYDGLVLLPLAILGMVVLAAGLAAACALASWALVHNPTARQPPNVALAILSGVGALLIGTYAMALWT